MNNISRNNAAAAVEFIMEELGFPNQITITRNEDNTYRVDTYIIPEYPSKFIECNFSTENIRKL